MKRADINEILAKYTSGELPLEDANTALEEAKSGLRLNPGQNELTPEDLAETTGGDTAEEANGWGLLETGTGSMEKVEVVDGKLEYAVNQIQKDGSVNMLAFVHIGGKKYAVREDSLTEI